MHRSSLKLKGHASNELMHDCIITASCTITKLSFPPTRTQATAASLVTAVVLLVAVLLVPEGSAASLGVEQQQLGRDPLHLQVSSCNIHVHTSTQTYLHKVSCMHNRIKPTAQCTICRTTCLGTLSFILTTVALENQCLALKQTDTITKRR